MAKRVFIRTAVFIKTKSVKRFGANSKIENTKNLNIGYLFVQGYFVHKVTKVWVIEKFLMSRQVVS